MRVRVRTRSHIENVLLFLYEPNKESKTNCYVVRTFVVRTGEDFPRTTSLLFFLAEVAQPVVHPSQPLVFLRGDVDNLVILGHGSMQRVAPYRSALLLMLQSQSRSSVGAHCENITVSWLIVPLFIAPRLYCAAFYCCCFLAAVVSLAMNSCALVKQGLDVLHLVH